MPNYAWDIKIDAGTTEASPKEQELDLTLGVITKLGVKFPSGCHGLVKVRLLRFKFQLIPLSGGEWITGDDEEVEMGEYYELKETPANLKFEGCSPDCDYEHTVTVRVTILPKWFVAPYLILEGLVKILKRILGLK